jgi:poly(ADP-ribose) glycohydrolase ARH3
MREQRSQPGREAGLGEMFRGALIGAAVGDALGAAFEGLPSVKPAELAQLEQEPGPLRYTDDTHMTLGMAQSLVERGGFDGPHMAGTFARNFEEEPWRGYGPGPPRVFRMLRQGVPWDQAGRALFGGGRLLWQRGGDARCAGGVNRLPGCRPRCDTGEANGRHHPRTRSGN